MPHKLEAVYRFDGSAEVRDLLNRNPAATVGSGTPEPTSQGTKPGRSARGMAFDGTDDDFTVVGSESLLNPDDDDFSFAVGVVSDNPGQNTEVIEKQSGNPLFQLFDDDASEWHFYVRGDGGSQKYVDSGPTVVSGEYTDLCCVHYASATANVLYKDGEGFNSSTSTDVGNIDPNTTLKIAHGTAGNFSG